MKKIHKKIGAVALASMIVAGGFAASKVESHAWWSSSSSVVISGSDFNLSKLPYNARVDVDYLIDYFKYKAPNIKVLAASNDKKALDNYINIKYDDDRELRERLLRVPPDYFYGEQVIADSNHQKSIGNNIIKVKFSSAYVLVYQK